MLNKKKKLILTGFSCLLFFILDRLIKNLYFSGQPLASLTFQKNFLFVFIFQGWFFYLLTALLLMFLVYLMVGVHRAEKYLQFFALSLILVGGVSNFLDRALHGFVLDYFNFLNLWMFNLADVMILSGALIFLWQLLRRK
jgi:lipoprotein signal peptidase